MFDAKKVKDQIVEWIRDWFEHNGPGCNAVIGISGGKDSSIVAALCVEALGKDRVIGVMMPNNYQRDLEDAKEMLKVTDTALESYDEILTRIYELLSEKEIYKNEFIWGDYNAPL